MSLSGFISSTLSKVRRASSSFSSFKSTKPFSWRYPGFSGSSSRALSKAFRDSPYTWNLSSTEALPPQAAASSGFSERAFSCGSRAFFRRSDEVLPILMPGLRPGLPPGLPTVLLPVLFSGLLPVFLAGLSFIISVRDYCVRSKFCISGFKEKVLAGNLPFLGGTFFKRKFSAPSPLMSGKFSDESSFKVIDRI